MPINNSYNEDAIVEAIATALERLIALMLRPL